MRNMKSVLAALATTTCIVALATPAYGAEARDYNIEAGSLEAALDAFGRQSGEQVLYRVDDVKGKVSPGARGKLSAEAALRKILKGSGLRVVRGAGGALAVTGGNAAPAPISAPERVRASQSQGRGTITGTVRDQVSGASLKGALVELVGTGRKTSTDDLGGFRFANAPTGDVTVRISYLGYAEQQSTIAVGDGETYAEDFTLIGGSGGQEIVVYGSRSARAQALNQERTAENVSTVISADMLGDFGGQTISESLRRAPGVSFQRDSFTGDGTNIQIRGLDPDMNTVKLNGVELPEGTGLGRSASLNNIQTESISKVTISKTLLANQDSSGTGGLVEIETKSPLDRPRRYANFSVEGAQRGNGFNKEFSVSGTLSAKFGPDEMFGLSGSVQYRDRKIVRVGYETGLYYGEYLPLQVDGTANISSISQVDPRLAFPFEPGADGVYVGSVFTNYDSTDGTILTTTLSGAVKLGTSTEWRFDWLRTDQDDYQRARTSNFTSDSFYAPVAIPGLGGQTRRALAWINETQFSAGYTLKPEVEATSNVFSFTGNSDFGKLSLRYNAGYSIGRTKEARYTLAQRNRVVTLNTEHIQSDLLVSSVPGRIFSLFPERIGSGVPAPALTPAGYAAFNNPANYEPSTATFQDYRGENSRWTGQFNARYEFGAGILNYLEAGVDFEKSGFRNRTEAFITDSWTSPRPTLAQLGVSFGQSSLEQIGLDSGFQLIDFADLPELLMVTLPARAISSTDPGAFRPGSYTRLITNLGQFNGQARTGEIEIAPYAQGRIDIGNLELIGGVRMTRYRTSATQQRSPNIYDENYVYDAAYAAANTVLITEKATQTKFLPRMLINFRPSENIVFRAGYYQSIARPQINLLSRANNITLFQAIGAGPNRTQKSLSVSKGNPDLKSARTDSYDLSAEYYDKDIGVLKLGFFYKSISNLLENNVAQGIGALGDIELPDDPRFDDVLANPADYFVTVTYPENNPARAKIWGIEAAAEKQLTFLPGALSGLGVSANYTYTKSSKSQPYTWSFKPVTDAGGNVTSFTSERIVFPGFRFNNQPAHTGSFALTYNKYGFDVNLAYTMQSRRKLNFAPYGLSSFEEGYNTFDARAEYRFGKGGSYRVFVEGTDLLRGYKEPSLELTQGMNDSNTGKYYVGGQYFGGRQIRAGVTATF